MRIFVGSRKKRPGAESARIRSPKSIIVFAVPSAARQKWNGVRHMAALNETGNDKVVGSEDKKRNFIAIAAEKYVCRRSGCDAMVPGQADSQRRRRSHRSRPFTLRTAALCLFSRTPSSPSPAVAGGGFARRIRTRLHSNRRRSRRPHKRAEVHKTSVCTYAAVNVRDKLKLKSSRNDLPERTLQFQFDCERGRERTCFYIFCINAREFSHAFRFRRSV